MYQDESNRAKELNRFLLKSGISLDDLAEPNYPALGIHSNSTLFYANSAFCNLIQYTQEEVIGLNAWMLFPPKSVEIITQKLKEKSTEPYQVIARTRDGNLINVEIKGKYFDLAGETARAVLVRKL
jgi:PAS domain S-box-containing protein